jgi:type I restriction enzyme S subunit
MARAKRDKVPEQKPFEQVLWQAADKLRKNIDAAEYKHVVLGLLFLKYVSDAFEELYNKIISKEGEHAYDDPEDKLVYSSKYVFFVPKNARWDYLVSEAKLPTIGEDVDTAMDLIEKDNPKLRGVLPKQFAKPQLDKMVLGQLVMGQSPPGNSYNESGQGVVFYQGRTDFGFRFPTPRVYCTEPTRFAQEGDTLMSVRAPVGDLNYAEESCCIGRGLSAIRHKNKQIHKSYTYYVLKSLRDQFDIHDDNGTIFGSISKDEFLALKCRKLQPSEVELYNERVGPIDDKVVLNCKQIKQLEQTRDTLLPKLMSGVVRINYN